MSEFSLGLHMGAAAVVLATALLYVGMKIWLWFMAKISIHNLHLEYEYIICVRYRDGREGKYGSPFGHSKLIERLKFMSSDFAKEFPNVPWWIERRIVGEWRFVCGSQENKGEEADSQKD